MRIKNGIVVTIAQETAIFYTIKSRFSKIVRNILRNKIFLISLNSFTNEFVPQGQYLRVA